MFYQTVALCYMAHYCTMRNNLVKTLMLCDQRYLRNSMIGRGGGEGVNNTNLDNNHHHIKHV